MKIHDKMYVGIDFSKIKFNACLLVDHEVVEEAEFPNTKTGYLKLVRWVKKASSLGKNFSYENVLFCGEHTGQCSLGLCEYLYEKGIRIWLENALTIKHASGLQRVKNDKADAQMIALYAKRFYIDGVSNIFESESPELKRLKSLYKFRERVVHERVAIGNAIEAGVYDNSPVALRQMKRRHEDGIADEKEIRKEMIDLMENSTELGQNYWLLTSIKGIGAITAALFLIYTSNFRRFDDPRKFSCFAGVAPFGKQSGTSIKTTPHVSHYANHDIKAALVESARAAIRFNPAIREYADRLRKKGKHEGIVLNNVKNKLIHIIFKIISTQQPWTENYQPNQTDGSQNKKSEKVNIENDTVRVVSCEENITRIQSGIVGEQQIYRIMEKNSILSKKSHQKICTET